MTLDPEGHVSRRPEKRPRNGQEQCDKELHVFAVTIHGSPEVT